MVPLPTGWDAEPAERSWRRLNGHNQLPKVILAVKFTDGIEVVRSQAQAAAASCKRAAHGGRLSFFRPERVLHRIADVLAIMARRASA
jgi:hypothetical protein